MQGVLVVNHFAKAHPFSEVCRLFLAAAETERVSLSIRTTGDFLAPVGEVPGERPDFVLFFDKDVHTARRMEDAGWRVYNSSSTIAVCDSKADTAEALAKAAVPTPKTIVAPLTFPAFGFNRMDFVERAGACLGFPLIIKEFYGSFGEQVYLAQDLDAAIKTVEKISPRPFLFQKFIAESAGRDIRVNVVGRRVVAAMERTGAPGDFRSNIVAGGTGRPVSLSKEQGEVALSAAAAVGADFAGVDLLLGEGGHPLVCEVNSNPQFAGTYACCGVNLGEAILAYIRRTL